MAVLNVEIDKLQYLTIGQQGESNATDVVIDMTTWVDELAERGYDNPCFHLLFLPYNQTVPLETAVVWDAETNTLTWTVTDADTAYAGRGYVEIRALNHPDNGLLKKSRVIPTTVNTSVSGVEGGIPPAPYDDWVNRILIVINQLNQAFDNAATEYVIQASADYDGTHPADSAAWSETMPDISTSKGNYLWTRLTIDWATGGTSKMYSVNYLNEDGTGIIDSVNGKTDANITLYGTDIAVSSLDDTKIPTAIAAKLDASKIVYTANGQAPVSPAAGTIWLKPKAVS